MIGCLKAFISTIISLILFVVLTVFSLAFVLHGTVLSSDFVDSQVDKIPVSAVAHDIIEDQLSSRLPQGSEFLLEVAYNVIETQDTLIKTQLKSAVNSGYDYFLNKTDRFTITIQLTDIKANLKDSFWQAFQSYLQQQLAGKSDAEISAYLQNIIQQLPQDVLPPELNALPITQRNLYVEQYLRDIAGVAQKVGAPILDANYKNLANQYVNQFLDDFVNSTPNSYTIDESSLDAGTINTFQNIRTGTGYYQTYYFYAVGLMVVLMALIFLVNWNIKVATRSLGIELLIVGVIDLVGIILERTLPWMQWLSQAAHVDIPSTLNNWVQGLVNDVTSVALPLTIGILVVGVLFIIISIIIPSRKRESLP